MVGIQVCWVEGTLRKRDAERMVEAIRGRRNEATWARREATSRRLLVYRRGLERLERSDSKSLYDIQPI